MSYGAYVEMVGREQDINAEMISQQMLPFEQAVGGVALFATQLEIDYSQAS